MEEIPFYIICNGQKYDIDYNIISSLSDHISLLKLSDPLLDEISVNTKYDSTLMNVFIDFLKLKYLGNDAKLPISGDNFLFFYDIAAQLGISEAFEDITEQVSKNDIFPHAIYILTTYQMYNINIYPIVDLIAENFETLASPDFAKLPLLSSRLIFDSPILDKDQNSELCLSILQNIFNFLEEPNHPLVRYLPFSLIPREEVEQFLRLPSLNLNKIRDILLLSYQTLNYIKSFEIYPSEGNYFSGLLSNVTFKAESSTPYDDDHDMNALLSPDPEKYYCSKEDNGYIMINFINSSVTLSHYELRGWKFAKNGVCPKEWTLEGTNDFQNWTLLDKKKLTLEENRRFQQNYGYELFEVKSEEAYQSFKFTQIANSNEGNHRFALSGFELYGKYSTN